MTQRILLPTGILYKGEELYIYFEKNKSVEEFTIFLEDLERIFKEEIKEKGVCYE